MWKNYFVIGYRSLWRNRTYTLINITGLTLAITALLLSSIYTRYELSYDKSHEKIDRIYQVNRDFISRSGNQRFTDYVSTFFKDEILPLVPGIEASTHLRSLSLEVRTPNAQIEQKIIFADPEVREIFTIPFVRGDESALQNPDNIWITEEAAAKFYPGEDAFGQSVLLLADGQEMNFLIGGIIKSLPSNSSMEYDFIAPFAPLAQYYDSIYSNSWNLIYSQTYILLDQNASLKSLHAEFDRFTIDENICDIPEERHKPVYRLQDYSTLHMHFMGGNHIVSSVKPNGLLTTIAISLVILVLACINFTTLSMGRLSTRMREVGIRKVLGSSNQSLRGLLFIETAILSLVALLPALALADIALPFFSNLTSSELKLKFDIVSLSIIFGILASVVLISGIYPSFVMSKFGILSSLKGSSRYGGKGFIRRILVFIQIVVSLILLSVTLIMNAQYNFVIKQDLGYDSQQLISIDASSQEGLGRRALTVFRDKYSGDKNIAGISGSAATLGPEWHSIGWKNSDGEDSDLISMNIVDTEFLKLLDIKTIKGRDFSSGVPSDVSNALIVNESFEKWLGLENSVGATVPAAPGAEIIGVIPDFYFNSLYVDVNPLLLALDYNTLSELETLMVSQGGVDLAFVLVKLEGGNIQTTINKLRKTWEQEFPEATWNMKFVDEVVENMYKEHLKWQQITSLATSVAILIALMGLIGLSAMQVARRTKEIGIRKVLGASLNSIFTLLTREIMLIVLLSNIIAVPVVVMIAKRLLNNFAYHINLNPLYFIVAFLIVLFVSMAASGALSLRAAQVNPVNSLRHE